MTDITYYTFIYIFHIFISIEFLKPCPLFIYQTSGFSFESFILLSGIVLPSCSSLFNHLVGVFQISRFLVDTNFVITIGNHLVLQSSQKHI